MNSILFCEGETDQFILKEYFTHQLRFRELTSNDSDKTIQKRFPERGIRLRNSMNRLDIVSSNGHEFSSDLNKILQINKINASDFYDHIVIFTDRDSLKEVNNVWNTVITEFDTYGIEISIQDTQENQENQWIRTTQPRDLDDDGGLSILLLAVPTQSEGALETFLLNVLRNQEGNSYLADRANQFVADILGKKDNLSREKFNPTYLKSRRMQVKAPLAVFFALIRPDRNFARMGRMFRDIPWHEYMEIQRAFQQLEVLGNMEEMKDR